MKRYQRVINVFILVILTATLLVRPENKAVAQGPYENDYYFPLFVREENPYYYYGLDGGTVEGVVIDPNDSNTLYANSWGAGVYKSVDGSVTWVNKSNGLQSAYIYELAVDPSNSSHVLASDYEHGISQSLDGGETWTQTSGLLPGSVIYSIDFNPSNPNIVYVALREPTYVVDGHSVYPGGVFKSEDGGSTWSEKSNGLPEDYVYDLAIDPNNPSIMYTAMHRTGVYRTTDGGQSWQSKNSTLIDGDARSVSVTPDSSRVYVGFWDGYGFSYSTNHGDSWVSVNWSNGADLYVYEVQADRNHPSSVYLTTSTGVYLCENPTASSSCRSVAHDGKFVFDLTLDVNGPRNATGYTEVMYTGLQHFAIFKSTDAGSNFEPNYKDIRANIINAMIVDPTNPAIQYVSSEGRGLFKTVDDGATWTMLHDALPVEYVNELVFRPEQPNVIYAGTRYDGVQISYNNGTIWSPGNGGLSRAVGEEGEVGTFEPVPADIYDWMDPVDLENLLAAQQSDAGARAASSYDVTTIGFHLDPALSQYMFIGTNGAGVKLSTNSGLNWSNSGLTSGAVTDSMVNPFTANNNYFVSLDGEGVRASTDRSTWYVMNSGLPANVYALAFIPSTTTYFAGTADGIYRAPNVGADWSFVGLDNLKVTDIQVDPSDPAQLWATTDKGLYHSGDSGQSWSAYPLPGLLNQNLLTIVPIPGTTEFFVGTSGGDYYRLTP